MALTRSPKESGAVRDDNGPDFKKNLHANCKVPLDNFGIEWLIRLRQLSELGRN